MQEKGFHCAYVVPSDTIWMCQSHLHHYCFFFLTSIILVVSLWVFFVYFSIFYDFHVAHRKNGIRNCSLWNPNVNLKLKP